MAQASRVSYMLSWAEETRDLILIAAAAATAVGKEPRYFYGNALMLQDDVTIKAKEAAHKFSLLFNITTAKIIQSKLQHYFATWHRP